MHKRSHLNSSVLKDTTLGQVSLSAYTIPTMKLLSSDPLQNTENYPNFTLEIHNSFFVSSSLMGIYANVDALCPFQSDNQVDLSEQGSSAWFGLQQI